SLATVFGTGLFYLSTRFLWADSVSAILVAILVGKAAWDIIKDAARDLVDTAPNEERIAKYRECALQIDGIVGVTRLRGRYYSRRVALDLDIQVAGTLSVDTGHDLAQRVRDRLMHEFPAVYDVVVHVDPASEAL
nr:cation diffusion facilitator family transporter [bacterium]